MKTQYAPKTHFSNLLLPNLNFFQSQDRIRFILVYYKHKTVNIYQLHFV